MTTLYLIRHAQAEGNLYRRCHGWYNSLITPRGYRQIHALEERFRHIPVDAAYSSDLFRTMTTAGAVCRPHNLTLRTDPALREINGGCWEDVPWGELFHRDPDSLMDFWHCGATWHTQDSETYPGVQQRFHTAVERIAAAHPGQTVAIFSHGTAIRTGLAYWKGLPPERIDDMPLGDNTCVSKLEFEDGQVRIVYYNSVTHLTPDLAHTHLGTAGRDNFEQTHLRFEPLSFPADEDYYLDCRTNGWMTSHGVMDGFDPQGFLQAARRCSAHEPGSVLRVIRGRESVGVLQLDLQAQAEQSVGRIPFIFLSPEARFGGLGAQLLGQAVSVYRKLGRQYLRLRCAPENDCARRFYIKNGFYKIGEEPGGVGHLDTMEKYIGYGEK